MYLKSEDIAVFMANGVFLENNSCIKFKSCEAVYVTVFPLSPALIPYTVKIVGTEIMPCGSLSEIISLGCGKYLAMFKKRYAYVYEPSVRPPCDYSTGCVRDFFDCVKCGNLEKARTFMTKELSDSVDDAALTDFLSGYKNVIKDENFVKGEPDSFLFVDDENVAHPHILTIKNNLIDDVSEK